MKVEILVLRLNLDVKCDRVNGFFSLNISH